MADLALEDFADAVGERFEMEVAGETYPVELIEASPLPPSNRAAGSFRLEFRGPGEPIFGQGTFTFRRGGREDEIFVCPIGRDQAGTRYEAVFF